MVPSNVEFDPSQHLTLLDIAVDDKKQPSVITVNIKQSKQIRLGRHYSCDMLCSWTSYLLVAILSYMAMRDTGKRPLFFEDECLLTGGSL